MALISVKEAAARLGIVPRRVVALISEGIIPAQRFGRTYAIDEKDVKAARKRPDRRGRPRKVK